jgi:hypothetical protein
MLRQGLFSGQGQGHLLSVPQLAKAGGRCEAGKGGFCVCDEKQMTDISKCSGEGCPVKGSCKRYTAKASPVQSWIVEPWDGETCEFYYEERSGEKIYTVLH